MSISHGAAQAAIQVAIHTGIASITIAFAYPLLIQIAYDFKNMIETGNWVYSLFIPLFGYFFRKTYIKMRDQARAEGHKAGSVDAQHEALTSIIEDVYEKRFNERMDEAMKSFTARLKVVEADNKRLQIQVTVLTAELTKHNIVIPVIPEATDA